MHNLTVAEVDEAKFDSETGLPLTATTFDPATNDLICAFGPIPEKPVIELRRRPAGLHSADHAITITSWDVPPPLADLTCDSILSLHYFHDSLTICLVLEGGDLILVREKPNPDQERIEIVGSIDDGIAAAQWSWNASFLALVTRAGAFVLMSRQLEPVNEVSLQEDDLKLSKHVSVGWGKRETQFQGKRAKSMKDPTMPDYVDEGKPSPNDDGKTTITWRGDGAYVAVNSTFVSPRRVIRIYSAEGVLDSVSEPVDGLESACSWRPYGNLIAGVKRSLDGSSKLEVVFFERNGLRHGQFGLRLSEDEMGSFGSSISLAWSSDSSILAVSMNDRVQLWTMGNYHYYLKQEFRIKTAPRINWHSTDPLRLNISSSTIAQSISLDFEVNRGSMAPPFDYGLVMVIDGKKLKVTPLKHVNVPPPMAYFELEAEDNIVACASSRTCQRIAFLTQSHLYLCRLEMRTANAKDTSLRHTERYTLEKKNLSLFPHPTQVVIHHDDQVWLLSPARNTSSFGQAFCHRFTWVDEISQTVDLRGLDGQVPRDTRKILLENNHGRVLFMTPQEVVSMENDFVDHQRFTGAGRVALVDLSETGRNGQLVFALTQDQRLQVNGIVKAAQVTSFACTNSHLVYTTSNHLLKFVHLTEEHEMVFPDDTLEVDERCRAIERGARIVTVIPSIYAVALQMPRGNLETIFPRILVVTGIREHIRNLDYRNAFLACQTHQVDMNILYDYDPQLWLDNVGIFIDQLRKPGRIDEFLQKVREEDVTETLYRDTSKPQSLTNGVTIKPHNFTPPLKTNTVCDRMIANLQTRSSFYTSNIITAHVCKRPPDLNSALALVSDLHKTSVEEADTAIAHLCFLTDTNRLFDAALALYDLNMTLLVAQNAQRDPREYMPFLQGLQSLPDLRRKYTIDNHLKNYAKALSSLHALAEHEEAEAYTIKYSLYSHAEELYKDDRPHLTNILRLHAEYLSAKSKHSAAAILYESLGDHSAAYPLYALAHQWRESLACASLVPIPSDKLESLARSLAITCVEENRDYRSAATIHLDYLSDPTTAAELLCKASYFAEATRILSMPSRNLVSQIAVIIDPALTRKFGEILELIAECQTQLKSQVPRVEELRIKKAEDPLAFYGGDAAIGDGSDIPDNISLAPTDASTLGGQSMFTRYGGGAGGSQVSTKFAGTVASNMSRRTSKTKRREERKRARGKKGSVYEEEYLVNSIVRLIDRVNGTHDEVHRLMSGLRRRGLREQAAKVEEVMSAIQTACEDAKKRIWSEVLKEIEPSTYNIDGHGRPSGADGILYDSQQEMSDGAARKAPPDVKVWRPQI